MTDERTLKPDRHFKRTQGLAILRLMRHSFGYVRRPSVGRFEGAVRGSSSTARSDTPVPRPRSARDLARRDRRGNRELDWSIWKALELGRRSAGDGSQCSSLLGRAAWRHLRADLGEDGRDDRSAGSFQPPGESAGSPTRTTAQPLAASARTAPQAARADVLDGATRRIAGLDRRQNRDQPRDDRATQSAAGLRHAAARGACEAAPVSRAHIRVRTTRRSRATSAGSVAV